LEEPKGWFPNSYSSGASPFLLLLSARKKFFPLGGEQKAQNSVLPIEGVNTLFRAGIKENKKIYLGGV